MQTKQMIHDLFLLRIVKVGQKHRYYIKLLPAPQVPTVEVGGILKRAKKCANIRKKDENLQVKTMAREVDPKDTTRASAYELWMNVPNPMVTFFKTFDVTNLIRVSKRRQLKFNMLLDYCIGTAAACVKEFYILPVGRSLIQYDTIAVNTIVKNKDGEVSSCDILYTDDLDAFNRDYLDYTAQTAKTGQDRDLSADSMVIGTSAIVETELDGVVGMNSGIFNNPFMIWGKYRKKGLRYHLPVSFQFHHTQMDGAHAGRFLENLQNEINRVK